MILLVPSDPMNGRRCDPQFRAQFTAARDNNWDVALVDHDALLATTSDGKGVSRIQVKGVATYRGWMLPSERYESFERALTQRGVVLRTTIAAYRKAHELPGWYEAFTPFTPVSAWTVGDDLDELVEISSRFTGPVVLRDYAKSMKHYWHEAMFIPDAGDDDRVRRVGQRFLDLRDDAFTGGFVLRGFEDFNGSTELRTWWIRGKCALVTAHPDTPDTSTGHAGLDLGSLAVAVASLDAPFITVDVARRSDGEWRVIEVGDGQVSDIPDEAVEDLIRALT